MFFPQKNVCLSHNNCFFVTLSVLWCFSLFQTHVASQMRASSVGAQELCAKLDKPSVVRSSLSRIVFEFLIRGGGRSGREVRAQLAKKQQPQQSPQQKPNQNVKRPADSASGSDDGGARTQSRSSRSRSLSALRWLIGSSVVGTVGIATIFAMNAEIDDNNRKRSALSRLAYRAEVGVRALVRLQRDLVVVARVVLDYKWSLRGLTVRLLLLCCFPFVVYGTCRAKSAQPCETRFTNGVPS